MPLYSVKLYCKETCTSAPCIPLALYSGASDAGRSPGATGAVGGRTPLGRGQGGQELYVYGQQTLAQHPNKQRN